MIRFPAKSPNAVRPTSGRLPWSHPVFRRVLPFIAVLWSLACGDSTSPPPFPAVAGTYQIDLTFDGIPTSLAFGSGTVSIVQPTRKEGALSGSSNISATVGSSTTHLTAFHTASVTEGGAIRFRINDPGASGVWGFDGTVTSGGSKMSGTHALVTSAGGGTGTWTATRR